MKLSRKKLWLFGAIAAIALILITVIAAPAGNQLKSGSTYSRSPDGYGAWYAFMKERGTPLKRWQKPFEDLANLNQGNSGLTFLRIYNQNQWSTPNFSVFSAERNWVQKGNMLILLGVYQPATQAPFSSEQSSPAGRVKIETTRRNQKPQQLLLGDRFGAVVWQEKIGKGRIIYAATPHLGANAYQDSGSNYEYLAQLVTQFQLNQSTPVNLIQNTQAQIPHQIWVDEYIHGYKDAEVIEQEVGDNIFSYFAQTPLLPILVQVLIFLLVAIWASNRRLGKPIALSTPTTDNSQAYIHALAIVLQKAESSDFVLSVVGAEEQRQLQKALGLGEIPSDSQSLINAWVQQTGKTATELERLLALQSRQRRLSETALLGWLNRWEQVRRYLQIK